VSAIVMCLLVVLLHLICDEQTPRRPPFDSGPIPSLTSAVYLPGARR
jgi:hypothetical protein